MAPVWKQEKLEVRNMPENGDESHLSIALCSGQALPYVILSGKQEPDKYVFAKRRYPKLCIIQ
jgi:hypothetical protein